MSLSKLLLDVRSDAAETVSRMASVDDVLGNVLRGMLGGDLGTVHVEWLYSIDGSRSLNIRHVGDVGWNEHSLLSRGYVVGITDKNISSVWAIQCGSQVFEPAWLTHRRYFTSKGRRSLGLYNLHMVDVTSTWYRRLRFFFKFKPHRTGMV